MNAKVLRVLEYDKVIHMLEQKATSDPGRQLCRDLVPMTDLAQIEQAQTETADALTRIFQKGSLNFGSNKPLGMCLRSLEIGSTLSSEELLRIAGLLENTARVKNFGFIRTIVSYVCCYVLDLGIYGIWMGIIADQFFRLVFSSLRFVSGKWTKIKI